MPRTIFRGMLIKIYSFLPHKTKLFFKKNHKASLAASKFLNFFLGLPDTISIATINDGPIKGFRMGLNLRAEKSYWLGVWETDIQRIFQDEVKEGMVVYDTGAHIGYFSLLFSKLCGKTGKVFSFEPDPDIFERLNQNIGLNNAKNIFPCRLAVSDKKGKCFFEKMKVHSRGHLLDGVADAREAIEVETETLDNFVFERKNSPPHIVKIDVEGAEGNVLRGMNRLLSLIKPLVVCEVHNYESAQEVFEVLSKNNYSIFHFEKNETLDNFKGFTGICHIIAKT